jgi:hypothetical protein
MIVMSASSCQAGDTITESPVAACCLPTFVDSYRVIDSFESFIDTSATSGALKVCNHSAPPANPWIAPPSNFLPETDYVQVVDPASEPRLMTGCDPPRDCRLALRIREITFALGSLLPLVQLVWV